VRVYFTRHGESYANTLGEMSARGLKHPLTPMGRQQALALAECLRPSKINRIFSSPILRAIETSVLIANELGIEYEVTDALREYDVGILEGQAGPEAWQQWQMVFDAWTVARDYAAKHEGGESFLDMRRRFVPFVNGLVQQSTGIGLNILCVGHGGLYWMMLPEVLANVGTEDIRRLGGFANTAVVVAEERDGHLVCVEWNGASYEEKR
jgi:2,3-bisphosphoglycerate-dependent phosphoglycerate mutase